MRDAFLICLLLIFGCNTLSNAAGNSTLSSIATDSGAEICKSNLALLNEKTSELLILPDSEFEIKSGITKLEAYSSMGDAKSVKAILQGQSESEKIYTADDINNSLLAAASAGSVDVISVLKTASNFDVENKLNKHAPIVTAAFCGHLGVVDMLLQYGVNPNSTDNQGVDAMMVAIMEDNIEMAMLLIRHGYNSCKNQAKNGKNVKKLAADLQRYEIAELLQSCN